MGGFEDDLNLKHRDLFKARESRDYYNCLLYIYSVIKILNERQ